MKELIVKKIESNHHKPDDFTYYSKMVDATSVYKINRVNWTMYPYTPEVYFKIAYNDDFLFLKYWVKENYLMAKVTQDNGPVCTDSCVEFFISPDENGYYNFEFNAIGTCLSAYGKSRQEREKAGDHILRKIIRISSSGDQPFEERTGNMEWNLFIAIPAVGFFCHNIRKFKSMDMQGNFYKCGDNLSQPHYLTWSTINTVTPDFHCPAFFGNIRLR